MEASQQTNGQPATAPANQFALKRRVPIDSLKLTVEEYEHAKTGAVHLHLASDSPENVFMVALRTVPKDSTGVAHILEHTVLCGSEKYPVRDPFFMMLRRSLNTFMNAFTSSDWTAYPFATQNRKDFDNLLNVYLDAVFFSNLDPLDFAQEGHRVEFEKDNDPNSPLVFKGVVFNEMKGAMSSTSSILWDRLSYELFPTNTYHYNSGGDPEAIPDLSYQELKDFYNTHYHPSNAVFLTFGDISAAEHQAKFESNVMARFERSDARIEVALEQTFDAPRSVTHAYAVDSADDLSEKTHLVLGWKLGESADLVSMLEAQLLSAVLMENSASPLMKYLETTKLGSAPSPLCGVEESMREMVFCCGIEGSEAEHAETFEREVLAVIEQVATDGVPAERLEAILHQIELHQREISGDGMPYGLNLMLRALSAATHYGDAVAAMDLDPVLAEIRNRIQDPGYIPSLLRKLLLDNTHRVMMTVVPDARLSERRLEAEKARLANLVEGMDEADKANVLDLTQKLKARQAQVDDPEVLPRVTLDDIPADIKTPSATEGIHGNTKTYSYPTGTNGLIYQQVALRLSEQTEITDQNCSLMLGLLTEVGLGDQDYLAVQDRHSATVGALSAGLLTRAHQDSEQECDAFFLLSSKALANRQDEQVALMFDTLTQARFDEHSRIREIVSQMRARKDQSITGSGHVLAMNAACAGMSPLAKRSHELSGLEGIRQLRTLDDKLDNDSEIEALGQAMADQYKTLLASGELSIATIADEDHLASAHAASIAAFGQFGSAATTTAWHADAVREPVAELWLTNTQVNFCAQAYPTVPSGHPDAPKLSVLSAVLRNGYLHRAVREQGGAYGGGASHDSNIGAFRFFSYRDPRMSETLADFQASIRWLLDTQHDPLVLEEAILGVIGSLDKPGSPAGEAKKHFHDQLFGRSLEQRRAFRRGVIETTLDDLRRVTETYLLNGVASTAVISNTANVEKDKGIADFGLTIRDLH